MSVSSKNRLKNDTVWRYVSRFLIVLLLIYFYPVVKNKLFPTQMTRLENMLRQSTMDGYHLAVDRQSESKIILTVFTGARSITTEIYRDVILELEATGDSRIFFTHAINRNADGVFYLSRTRIEADPDLKKVRRLEVSVCDRIKSQDGRVRYDGHEPIYECEVPLQEAICMAAE